MTADSRAREVLKNANLFAISIGSGGWNYADASRRMIDGHQQFARQLGVSKVRHHRVGVPVRE